jgi:hypothetical protein
MNSQSVMSSRTLRLVVLAVIGLLATSFQLWSQQATAPKYVPSEASHPFVLVDELLSTTADSLLASAVSNKDLNTGKAKETSSTLEDFCPSSARQSQPRREMRNNNATAQLFGHSYDFDGDRALPNAKTVFAVSIP